MTYDDIKKPIVANLLKRVENFHCSTCENEKCSTDPIFNFDVYIDVTSECGQFEMTINCINCSKYEEKHFEFAHDYFKEDVFMPILKKQIQMRDSMSNNSHND